MGALTTPLVKKGLRLDLIELDRDLVALLTDKFKDVSNLNVHSADALSFDFSSLVEEGEKLRVIGNLLESTNVIEDMHFMLQKEVVDRICAGPGNKQYGKLSIMMQYYCETEWLFDVPPESFDPKPKVMSAIVKLIPHPKPLVDVDVSKLNRVVTEAFSQRRKTLRNSLQKLLTEEQIVTQNINPTLRAENLSLSDFAKLANVLSAIETDVAL
jgi:16S rRNA (adenine1518-N6/adenine1519-N6)-dimethyltransferase